MVNNVLLCGNRSFIATGLNEVLNRSNLQVDNFTRGTEDIIGNTITGDVFKMSSNKYLQKKYDTVINFTFIKNESIEENIRYIEELVQFCIKKEVKRLIHVSSIMVYNYNESTIDENTQIDNNTEKTGYRAIKIEVDKYLQSLESLPFKVVFIRPGYIIAEDRPIPFLKKLLFNFVLIKGDRKSNLPIVKRQDIHIAIVNMLKQETLESIYLFVPSDNKTKYEYAKSVGNYRFFFLPKWLILGSAKFISTFGLFSKSLFIRIKGMYIETKYDSSRTEQILNIKF